MKTCLKQDAFTSTVLYMIISDKKKHCIIIILAGALLLLKPATAIAQNLDWKYDTTIASVDFYHSISNCNDRPAVFLKFNNHNTRNVLVGWKEVIQTQFDSQVEPIRGKQQLSIPAGEIFQTGCNVITSSQLILLQTQVAATYVAEIRKYSYYNITVSVN